MQLKDKVTLYKLEDGNIVVSKDSVAIEEPLEVRIVHYDSGLNKKVDQLFTTMRTPGKDVALVAGYMLTSGLIDYTSRIFAIVPLSDNLVQVDIDPHFRIDIDAWNRINAGNSACGICGTGALLDQSVESNILPWSSDFTFNESTLKQAIQNLEVRQELFLHTGGYHAACLFDKQGMVTTICEDVGRHNAVDKAFGIVDRIDYTQHGLMVTSRCSYEIVAKAIKLGCPMIVAFGAATSLAIELAADHSICLIGFAKRSNFNIYTHPHRLTAIDTHASS